MPHLLCTSQATAKRLDTELLCISLSLAPDTSYSKVQNPQEAKQARDD